MLHKKKKKNNKKEEIGECSIKRKKILKKQSGRVNLT
jgi:hypothetical protein